MTYILAIPFDLRLAILFVLGCCAGGAINLGIYRLAWFARPLSPWSRPHADAPRRVIWDRLPVVGWLGLRREAALHGPGFWIRPLLVELLTGALFAILYWWEVGERGLVPKLTILIVNNQLMAPSFDAIWHEQYLAHIVLAVFMLMAFWIDLDEMTIPDGVTIPGTLLGLALVTLWPYVLLPDSSYNSNGPLPRVPATVPVWLSSPDETLALGLDAPPLFIMPWQRPIFSGHAALLAAAAGFSIWCLALVPGRWSTRHGYWRAIKVYTARAVRERATYALLALAIIGSLAIAAVWRLGGPHWAAMESSLAGIVVGGGLVWIIRFVSSAMMHREAMGFGDVTLLAMIGAFFGWQAAVIVFFLAPLAAIVFAVGRLVLRGEKEIPFGPFLCVAAASLFFIWPGVWDRFGETCFSHGWQLILLLLAALILLVILLPPVRWLTEGLRRLAAR